MAGLGFRLFAVTWTVFALGAIESFQSGCAISRGLLGFLDMNVLNEIVEHELLRLLQPVHGFSNMELLCLTAPPVWQNPKLLPSGFLRSGP